MNEIINKLLLAGDNYIPEMHLRLGFTYSACGPFTKNKERKKIKETGDSRYIYQNELDEAGFQHDMAYGDFKDSHRTTAADKVLRDRVFNIAKYLKCDGYQPGLVSMVYKSFDKKTSDGTIIKILNKRKVHSPFIDDIWDVQLADMQLMSKFSKGSRFLLFV